MSVIFIMSSCFVSIKIKSVNNCIFLFLKKKYEKIFIINRFLSEAEQMEAYLVMAEMSFKLKEEKL